MDPGQVEDNVVVNLPHHVQQELCTTRAPYRQGRKLTAVKVYTVNNESQHLLIYRVPAINLRNELEALCANFGEITTFDKLELVDPGEEFTEIYHACYSKIRQSRKAKRQLDGRSFYGSLLHVCYAPELESVEETRVKLVNRRHEIAYFTGRKTKVPNVKPNSKLKRPTTSSDAWADNKRLKMSLLQPEPLNDSATTSSGFPRPASTLHVDRVPPMQQASAHQLSYSLNGESSTAETSAGSFVLGPYDHAPSYPSQEILRLPGQEVKSEKERKFTPAPIVKKYSNVTTNKIIFHHKNAS